MTQIPGLALVAFAGVAGDLAYASASQHGALSVVSAVSSLYPVATIALGVAIQRQRPNRIQVAGIILALVARQSSAPLPASPPGLITPRARPRYGAGLAA